MTMPVKKSPTEIHIEHHGVKDMKWGVRRDEQLLNRIGGRRTRATGGTKEQRKAANAKAKQDWKDYKSSTTKKQRKADKKAVAQEKLNFIMEKVAKKPTSLFVTRDPSGQKTVVAGGRLNAMYTDMFMDLD